MDERSVKDQFLSTRSSEDFCALFRSLYPRLYRYFIMRGADSTVSEELAQNVMFTVYKHAGELRDKELFYGWLFKIAKNELAAHIRKQQTRDRIFTFEPLNDELAQQLSKQPDYAEFSTLTDWLSTLEPAEREIIMLRYVEELSYDEISDVMSIPMGTVKWRLFNTKRKLSKQFQVSSQFPVSSYKFQEKL